MFKHIRDMFNRKAMEFKDKSRIFKHEALRIILWSLMVSKPVSEKEKYFFRNKKKGRIFFILLQPMRI
jgi:hypothetical protein